MIHRILLSTLGVIGLLLASAEVARAQESSEPMVVVLKDGVSLEGFGEMYRVDERARRNPAAWAYLDQNVVGAVQALEAILHFSAQHVYSAALRGFAARLTASQISALRNHWLVAYVEPDRVMRANVQALPWGVDRIEADVSSTLAGNGSGAITNVHVYIIDTGIDRIHTDLTVVEHFKFLPFPNFNNNDCNSHGTHVAGTVAAIDNDADVVGVAPGAPLHGIKVLNCFGTGQNSSVIQGVDWVTANGQLPAVVNMSLGGAISQALNDAVANSMAAGFFYAVAAGNEAVDACTISPASAGVLDGIMTIAATDTNEQEPDFSNFGSCVDIWAPGVDIVSTALRGGTVSLSGTSMASPHVAGAAALFLSNNPTATPAQVEAAIKAAAVSTGTNSKDSRAITRLNVAGF